MNEQIITGSGRKKQEVIISGGTVTVDTTGLATSAKQDTQTTELTSIKTAVETIDNAIAGTEMQVDVVTAPAIATGDNTIGRVKITDGTTVATVRELGTNDALNVAIADGSGNQITSFGGGTQYTEADTDASITGTAMMMEGAVNTLVPAQGTAADGLLVNLGTNNDVTVTGTVAVTQSGTWDEVGINDSGNSITVDNGGTFVTQENGAALTSLQLIDDTVATLGTDTYTEATSKGIIIGGVRRDADTTLANTTNEFAPFQLDANGYLKVEAFSGQTLPISVASAQIASGAIASGAIASGAVASGAIASGAIASGAIAAGAIAAGATSIATTEDTASAAGDHLVKVAQIRLDTPVSGANLSASGDYTQFIADSFGKTWVTGTYAEDLAHVAGEAIVGNGVRRIDTPATSAGTSGDWATMNASAEGALWTTNTPTTTGGCTIFRTLDLDETEEEVKATAGNVYGYYFYNAATSVRYLKFYNATAASVSVGTTTPVLTFPLPASSAGHISFGFPVGFATAICVAATTGVADADTGAPAANDVILNVFYK